MFNEQTNSGCWQQGLGLQSIEKDDMVCQLSTTALTHFYINWPNKSFVEQLQNVVHIHIELCEHHRF